MTPAGRPRRARKRGSGFLPCPLYLLPHTGPGTGPRRPSRCPHMGNGGGAALGGPVRRAAATGCSGLYRCAAPAGRRWVLCPIRTPGRDVLVLHPGQGVDAAALIGAASTTRTAPEGRGAGRRLPALSLYLLPPHGARSGPRRPRRCLPWGTAAVPTLGGSMSRAVATTWQHEKESAFWTLPLSICIAQFAFVLVERVAGQPCQLHDLCV